MGWFMNSRMSVTETANKAIREINLMLHQLNELRRMVANSHLLSNITYGIPMMIGAKYQLAS